MRISFEPFAAHVPSTGWPTDADELLAEARHLTVRVAVERERRELVRELLGEPVGQRAPGTRSC